MLYTFTKKPPALRISEVTEVFLCEIKYFHEVKNMHKCFFECLFGAH